MRATRFLIAAALLLPAPAMAQPADLPIPPATTDKYPPGVKVGKTASGPVYVDRRGLTLYGMDMRTLLRWAPDPAQYCTGACAEEWEPLLAPADAVPNIEFPRSFQRRQPGSGMVDNQKAPDWTVIRGPQGPQWVYKGWHVVFTRKGSKRGSTEFEGAQDLTWNTLKFVPPVPQVTAPPGVQPKFVGGAYALVGRDDRVLFTGTCHSGCDNWKPLAAPMAGRGIGQWTVSRSGDTPQWALRGKPVFVTADGDPEAVPVGAQAVRP